MSQEDFCDLHCIEAQLGIQGHHCHRPAQQRVMLQVFLFLELRDWSALAPTSIKPSKDSQFPKPRQSISKTPLFHFGWMSRYMLTCQTTQSLEARQSDRCLEQPNAN
eukprot:5327400-Amphidinium_carterae.1